MTWVSASELNMLCLVPQGRKTPKQPPVAASSTPYSHWCSFPVCLYQHIFQLLPVTFPWPRLGQPQPFPEGRVRAEGRPPARRHWPHDAAKTRGTCSLPHTSESCRATVVVAGPKPEGPGTRRQPGMATGLGSCDQALLSGAGRSSSEHRHQWPCPPQHRVMKCVTAETGLPWIRDRRVRGRQGFHVFRCTPVVKLGFIRGLHQTSQLSPNSVAAPSPSSMKWLYTGGRFLNPTWLWFCSLSGNHAFICLWGFSTPTTTLYHIKFSPYKSFWLICDKVQEKTRRPFTLRWKYWRQAKMWKENPSSHKPQLKAKILPITTLNV